MYDDFEDEAREARNKYTIANIKMTLTRDQIMTFVGGLHETQMELIEAMVSSRERQGFPEATAVIKSIMERK